MKFSKESQEAIDNARQVLESHGYYVNNLWHVDDVKGIHECSDEEAYNILEKAIDRDGTYEQIWMAIQWEIDEAKN